MKTKKHIFTLVIVLIFNMSYAQIKVINNGQVGVGTNNPITKFHIYHPTNTAFRSDVMHTFDWGYNMICSVTRNATKAFAVQKNGAENLTIYGDGSLWAQGICRWSDKRCKKNIQPLSNALEKIQKLNGVSYEVSKEILENSEVEGTKTLGFIAQEVETIIPEAIRKDEKGFYAMDYEAVIPLLVEAIKEQQQQAEVKAVELEKLKNDIIELNNALSQCCEKKSSSYKTGSGNNINTPADVNTTNKSLLYQNIPNPFSSVTSINCYIPVNSQHARLIIYDLQGKQLKEIPVKGTGEQSIEIKAKSMEPGMYLYALLVDNKEVDIKRMIITE